MFLLQRSKVCAALAAIAILPAAPVCGLHAQEVRDAVPTRQIRVTDADVKAAANVKWSSYHVMAANMPGAKQKAAALNAANAKRVAERDGQEPRTEITKPKGTLAQPYFYPADLSKGSSTAVLLKSAVHHAVYVNLPGKTTVLQEWGNPEGFLTDLFKSTFIHLVDQYTGSTTGTYTVGPSVSENYGVYGNVIYEHEIWSIVHAAASLKGFSGGTGQVDHVFLPNGMDTCFDETSDCYSPDNFATWDFCAYHDSVKFSDKVGVVLFTVEPYQKVDGCAVHQPSANGELIDSTDSVLSHETFETISDPEPDSGWTNQISLDLEGAEIGDECQPVTDDNGDFLVPKVSINGKEYSVQLEYSNTYHACAAQP